MTQPFSLASTLAFRRLSLRLLLAIGGCSLLFILVAIAFQLSAEYRRDVAEIEARLGFIEESYVPALAASAFQLDEEQVRLQLRGMLQLRDIVFVRVQEQLNRERYAVEEGDPGAPAALSREFPLIYQAREPVPVGTLQVRVSLDGVHRRLKERILTIAISNALLVGPLALAILAILQLILHRHLTHLAQYARSLGPDTLDAELRLQRPAGRPDQPDELDQLVQAINGLRLRIREDLQHRQEAENELMFRKTLLECVLEARLEGLFITGRDGTCLFANSQFHALWQLGPEGRPGSPARPVFARIQEQLRDAPSFQAVMARVGEQANTVVQGEWVLNSGAIYEYDTVPVGNTSGVHYGRLWSFRDVSQRKFLEEQLRQSRKLETLGQLAGGIAHDFNNLLSPILGYAELGSRRLAPDDPLAADLAQIVRAAGRAADLTRQILAFSRKQVLEVRLIDLNELVRDFAKMLKRLIGESIAITTRFSPRPALIRADQGQIEQVVLNLAVNARDAMREGGGTLTLKIADKVLDPQFVQCHPQVKPGEYVCLTASDTGIGMAPAVLERIFEPFFTTKEPGHGTGLGLATAFGIVRQHNGHIFVESEPGRGTTFQVFLPRAAGEPTAQGAEPHDSGSLEGDERILVVEDDPMVRAVVCDTLAAHGYSVLAAEEPAAALKLAARAEAIDLLLTDVILPQMHGRELQQLLRSRLPRLKVLYMSGYSEEVVLGLGQLHQGGEFLQKPFSVLALLRKVREVLTQAAAGGASDPPPQGREQ